MNTLNGYSKSTLTDNNVLTAAGGHLAVGNADQNIPINNGTVNTNLNADLLDNLHASDFVKITPKLFSLYKKGIWTKIITFTITNNSIDPSISFSWHPTECARYVWADFNINIRLGAVIFMGNWKGSTIRTLKCVGDGTTYDVWVSGTKDSYDPYGAIQITSTYKINSYNTGSLAYQDSEPTGTYSANVSNTAISNYANSAGNADSATNADKTKYLQTQYKDNTNWYADSYKAYLKWETSNIAKLKIDGYYTKVDYSVDSDTVDGIHASGLLTALSSNTTNAVSITVGGTTKNITTSTLKTSLGLGSNAYTSTAYLPLAGGTMNTTALILAYTRSKGSSDVYNGAILLREATGSTTSCDDNMYDAPGITFHWGNKWVHKLNMHTNALYWDNNKLWHDGNDGSGSGLDADKLDGMHATGLLTSISSTANTNLSITVGGTTKSVNSLYANTAKHLEHTGGNTDSDKSLGLWFLVGELVIVDKALTNNNALFYVTDYYHRHTFGILRIEIRLDTNATKPTRVLPQWLVNNGFTLDNLQVSYGTENRVINSVTKSVIVLKIYIKAYDSNYSAVKLVRISDGGWSSESTDQWTLVSNRLTALPGSETFTQSTNAVISNNIDWSNILNKPDLDLFVTLNTAQTITGLKTFESNSSTTGVSLILKNKGWVGNMSTAMDFYNGNGYKVPNARIETRMLSNGTNGGTLIFYTQTKHTSTNPNPNGLTERLRIGDDNTIIASSVLHTTNTAGSWLSGMTNAAIKYDSLNALNSGSYHPIIGVKTNGENVVNFGAYINDVGFYGYKKGRTENSYDWLFKFNSETGAITHTGTSITATKFIGNLNNTLTFSAGAFSAKTYNNSAVVTVNIPTHTSHLTNNSGFLTQHLSLANYVTLNTEQTITESKTFSKLVTFSATPGILVTRSSGVPYFRFGKDASNVYGAIGASSDGNVCVYNDVTGNGWHTVLHSTNYTNYTVKKDGTGASGTWGINISGNAGTATSASNVTVTNSDETKTLKLVFHDGNALKSTGGIYCNPSTDTLYSTKVIATNFTSNVATGTQPYACTSTTVNTNLNADMLDGLHLNSSTRNNEANKVVRTDGSGYTNFGWINTTSGNFTGTPDRIYASNDGYIRYMTLDNFRANVIGNNYWKVNDQTTAGTGDIYLEMWCGVNASWKILNAGGVLKFLNNYTSSAGSYFDCLTVDYNTGNTWIKGNLTNVSTTQSNRFYLRNNGTTGKYADLQINTRGTKCTTAGTAGTTGVTYLFLGNSTAVSSTIDLGAENALGILRIYGSNTGYTDIRCGTNNTGTYTMYLPGATGLFVYHTNDTAIGSSTKPVYIASTGAATECSTYAGGTAITLNGTSKAATTASFYAPTSAGTNNYVLKSNGSGAPDWVKLSTLKTKWERSEDWNALLSFDAWCKVLRIKNYSSILFSIILSQTSQACSHTYMISVGWNSAKIIQLGYNGYSGNCEIPIRLVKISGNLYDVEIKLNYLATGLTSPLSVPCRYICYSPGTLLSTYTTHTINDNETPDITDSLISSYNIAKNLVSDKLGISDLREEARNPNDTNFPLMSIAGWFNNKGTPNTSWHTGITIRSYANNYSSWQLCSYASTGTDNDNYRLYHRSGNNNTWKDWKPLAYLLEVNNILNLMELGSESHPIILMSGTFGDMNTSDRTWTFNGAINPKIQIVAQSGPLLTRMVKANVHPDGTLYFPLNTDNYNINITSILITPHTFPACTDWVKRISVSQTQVYGDNVIKGWTKLNYLENSVLQSVFILGEFATVDYNATSYDYPGPAICMRIFKLKNVTKSSETYSILESSSEGWGFVEQNGTFTTYCAPAVEKFYITVIGYLTKK